MSSATVPATPTAYLRARLVACACLFLGLLPLSSPLRAERPIRLSFSASMFAGINDADAKASVKVLVTTLSKEKNIEVDETPPIFTTTEAMHAALSERRVDSVAVTADELWVLRHDHPALDQSLVVAQRDPGEEYVLLVRKDRGIQSLADLHGARLTAHFSSRMRVGYFWLELMLARQGLPDSERFFAETNRSTKLNKVVLDVFFKKADCCLVSRRNLAAVFEMNPQVGRQLVPLLESERLATRMFLYHKEQALRFEALLKMLFDNIGATVSGRQALTIFQVEQIVEVPPDELIRSLEMLDALYALRREVIDRMAEDVRMGKWQASVGSLAR